jgi:hypothetical protein
VDGSFLIRKSSKSNAKYTLCLYYKNKIRNLHIRERENDHKYALGEAKENEKVSMNIELNIV